MTSKIIQKIQAKSQGEELLYFLSKKLSGSELNSLLMEVFNERIKELSPNTLLQQYQQNRFVGAVSYNPISFREYELKLLKEAQHHDFEVIEFSPAAPLGSCSVLGPVDQKKILSAIRNAEIASDVTNLLALEIAARKKKNTNIQELKMASVHRHIRGQKFDMPGFTPYFSVLSLVSSGKDLGNYSWEIKSIVDHIQTYQTLLQKAVSLSPDQCKVEIQLRTTKKDQSLYAVAEKIKTEIHHSSITIIEQPQKKNAYYQRIKFGIKLQKGDQWIEVIDGGLVDWTQKLLQNRKERLLISGMGSEFIFRIFRKDS